MTRESSSSTRTDLLDQVMFGGLLIFLLLLPFHLVIKKLIPDPVGTYWKEALLAFLVLLWAIRSVRARRILWAYPPLDWAILVYAGLFAVRFLLDGPDWTGAWGLYASIMYLPVVWIAATVLRQRSSRLLPLFASLVGVGAIVAIGGLIEFIWNVPLWPSEEIIQRQGFPGMFIYGTNIRRVYFTFDSPTTLANTLAMLLPVALTLILVVEKVWARVVAGLAAALMAACIVVTFSRGIWVAAALSLVVMAIWLVLASRSGQTFVRRYRTPLLLVGGALVLGILVWALVWLAWQPWATSTYEGVVELPSPASEQVYQDLLSTEPLLGQVTIQRWSIDDPVTGQETEQTVLYQAPTDRGPQEVLYTATVPENGALRFSIALSPEVWSPDQGDGVSFQVYVASTDQPVKKLAFQRYLNPKDNINDRRWRNFLLDLSPWAGETVYLGLSTEPGPAGDWSYDWAGWAEPQLVSVAPGYFASSEAEGAILRHTSSLLDWTQDETNRDRLGAWSQGLSAWSTAPLWGTGLGTTGVAALRTQPEKAYVTESQVLKSLVELGPLGLLALAFLWFQIARIGIRAYRRAEDPKPQTWLIGILTSLLVVFVEGWVYQNLEVKQVNAYFWTLVGTLAFLAWSVSRPAEAAQPAPEPATSDEKLAEPDE